MGNVVAILKVYPSDVGLDLERIKGDIRKAVPEGASVYKYEEEPIAFGLVAIVAYVMIPEDREGLMDEVDARIRGVEGVGNVEVWMVSRV